MKREKWILSLAILLAFFLKSISVQCQTHGTIQVRKATDDPENNRNFRIIDDVPSGYKLYIVNLDTLPEYPGGQTAYIRFIDRKTKYPRKAKKNGIYARFDVEFSIDSTDNKPRMHKEERHCGCSEMKSVIVFIHPDKLSAAYADMCREARRVVKKSLKDFKGIPQRMDAVYVASVDFRLPDNWTGIVRNGRIVGN